jgi:hypothetical protein
MAFVENLEILEHILYFLTRYSIIYCIFMSFCLATATATATAAVFYSLCVCMYSYMRAHTRACMYCTFLFSSTTEHATFESDVDVIL